MEGMVRENKMLRYDLKGKRIIENRFETEI